MKNLAYRFLNCSLALLLAINTAAAGRWMRSCWDAPACGPAPVCEPVDCCPVETCCEPVVVDCGGCDGCGAAVMTSGCGCDGAVVGEPVVYDVHEANATPAKASEPPAPTEVYEPAPTATFGGGFRSDNAVADEAAPSDDWNAGFEEPAEPMPAQPAEQLFVAPAPVEEPAEDLFAEPAPAQPAEPIEEPADDLFAEEPVAEEPMEEDTLFGAPAEEPADDLFAEEPVAEDSEEDLFAEPAAEEPAEDLFSEPAADEPAEDLFAEPAAEGPTEDLFAEPAEEEAAGDLFGVEEEPMEDEDDLFAEPAEEEAAEDLFSAPEEDAEDDLFSAEEEPMEEDGGLFDEPAEAVEDAAEDLFSPDAAEPSDADAEEDLFDFGSILREPGGVDSVAQRTWVDNTGRYSTVGRLLAIDGGVVRLAKENGALATVPLSRLSQSDLEFVSRQSVAMHQAREHAIARGATPADDAKQVRTDDELPLRTAQL